VVPPAANGDFVQIADNTTTSNNYNLNNLGFLSTNRFDGGAEPVQANNQFQLEVTSTSGNAAGPFDIVIPPNSYASLDDVAVAVQQQIDVYIGAGGLNGKVTVAAVGGQLVFTNTNTGAGEGISITGTAAEPLAAGALGFNSLFAVTGQDEIDKTNSFRLNLTVPAPDNDNRSGSVLISLDEDYRSVQQLATSINRQLNSQNADDYIGIRAQAVEISPKVVPPQFTLELLAVEEGESSIISISNVSASGPDISSEDLFAILQSNPADGSLLTTGIEGVNNQYPEQQVTIVDPDGNETTVTIPEGTEANEIASIFNQQAGLTATANTVMTVPLSSYNNPGNLMNLTVNGQILTSTTLPEIADEINGYRGTTLPGFLASISEAGDLVITNEIGRDVKLEINSASPTDSLVVMGAVNTGPVVLGGTATAASAAAVGGNVTFTLNEGYSMQEPQPIVSGLFGALSDDEFTPIVLNAFDPLDQNTYNHATSTTMYDSLGNNHVLTQYFVKEPLDPNRPNEQNIWAMYVQVDGQNVGDPDSTLNFPDNLTPTPARYELFFNQDGTLDTEATGEIYVTNWDPLDGNGDSSGALNSVNVLEGGLPLTTPPSNSNFQITLDGSTQFGSSFSVSEVNQDGYTTGRLAGLEVDQEGVIFARYTNGQAQVLGQVALANFRNPEGLTPLGDTGWAESFESGVGTVGSPRTASFGQVRSSALEDSNVDISEELVGLIIAQRNFQASAKTIETMDQVTQTILNI
jgi:flagellar hook protein FlgE